MLVISLMYVVVKKYLNSFANPPSSGPNEEPAPEIQVVDYIESVDHLVTNKIFWFVRVLLSICTVCLSGVFSFIDQCMDLETIEPTSEGIPPNSSFAGIPHNSSSEGIPPNNLFERILENSSSDGLPPNSFFEGIPPNSSFVRIPPNSCFEGISPNRSSKRILQNNSSKGIPPNRSSERILQDSSAKGIPPNRSPERILQNSSSKGITQNTSPTRILQNIQTVPAEVAPVGPKIKRPNLGRGEGLSDSERRNLGWNGQEGWWVRRLRSGKIYGHVAVSNIRSPRAGEVSRSKNRNDEGSQAHYVSRMTSGDYWREDDTVPLRKGKKPQISRPKSLFPTSRFSTTAVPFKGRVPKSSIA